MTCLEKWKEMYPNGTKQFKYAHEVVKHECPSSYGIMSNPLACGDCAECWHRTIPDTSKFDIQDEPLDKTQNLIRNWTIEKVYGGFVICGDIYNDQRNRFADGTPIHTSKVQQIDFVKKIAKTLNSTYNLE